MIRAAYTAAGGKCSCSARTYRSGFGVGGCTNDISFRVEVYNLQYVRGKVVRGCASRYTPPIAQQLAAPQLIAIWRQGKVNVSIKTVLMAPPAHFTCELTNGAGIRTMGRVAGMFLIASPFLLNGPSYIGALL